MRHGKEADGKEKKMISTEDIITIVFPSDYEFVPKNFWSICKSHNFNFTIEGFDPLTMFCDPSVLNHATEVVFSEIKNLFEKYQKDYIFNEPELFFRPFFESSGYFVKAIIGFNVGMVKREVFEESKKKLG